MVTLLAVLQTQYFLIIYICIKYKFSKLTILFQVNFGCLELLQGTEGCITLWQTAFLLGSRPRVQSPAPEKSKTKWTTMAKKHSQKKITVMVGYLMGTSSQTIWCQTLQTFNPHKSVQGSIWCDRHTPSAMLSARLEYLQELMQWQHCIRYCHIAWEQWYQRHSVNVCIDEPFPKYSQALWVEIHGCRSSWKQQDDFAAKGHKTHLSLIVLNY